MRAGQTNEGVAALAQFSLRERLAKFPGDRGRDGAAADGNATRKNFSGFDKKNVGRARADIHQQRATRDVAIVIFESSVKPRPSEADRDHAQSVLLDGDLQVL